MDVLVGLALGLASGLAGGFVAAILQLAGKQLRNARLVARGAPPYKDCILVPLWKLTAPAGLLAGAIAAIAGAGRLASALAGAALPAIVLAITVTAIVAQAFAKAPVDRGDRDHRGDHGRDDH